MDSHRQNFHEKSEAAINKQINIQLYASYIYLRMAYHFDRGNIALPGFSKFFKGLSDEERAHAEELIKYQNLRGGLVVIDDIKAPMDEWITPNNALEEAFNLKKKVNDAILNLDGIANSHQDPHLHDFLTKRFLREQVESIKKISNLITNAKRCGEGLGLYQFDKLTM
ncbi:soma ferritin [Hydra vulgaris]|uniref:soma ferritin n=1 Tax=Hydra vulgaris TaxID=6087 RepID=UPI0001924266|nr:soma ferritin-like [Hydra vulgaris]